MKRLFRFVKAVFQEFSRDKVGQQSAAFAYVAIFSIGPLLLVLISMVGFIYGEKAASGQLIGQLSDYVGSDTAKTIQDAVAHTSHSGSNALALALGIIGTLLGASALTAQLQNSFDLILGVVPDPKAGLKRTVYTKLKNVAVVLLGGVLVTASILVSAIVMALAAKGLHHFSLPSSAIEILNNLVSVAVFAVLLYMIYRVIPGALVPRKIALTAAACVAILFVAGKVILALVIGRNGAASAYGAAASLVTLLLWVYYSGQIVFLGMEGIKVHGFNASLEYAPKRFNLMRETLVLDSDSFTGRLVKAFHRGFTKGQNK